MQTALPAAMALTYPGTSLIEGGLKGIMAEQNRWSVLAPLGTMFVTGLLNLAFIGPATTQTMKERKHQGPSKSISTTYQDLTHARNPRRQEELRSSTALRGDAENEQALYEATWGLVVNQSCWTSGDCLVWRYIGGDDEIAVHKYIISMAATPSPCVHALTAVLRPSGVWLATLLRTKNNP